MFSAAPGSRRVVASLRRDDFHGLLTAIRLFTGQGPKLTCAQLQPARATSGELRFYRDRKRDGTGDVSNPSVIGLDGWQNFKFLFSGGNAIIYAVDQNGKLLFYRDKTQNGTGMITNPAVIGLGGWQGFRHLFAASSGIIYAVVP